MHRMTQLLLDLARFEAGEVNLKQVSVDLGALVEKRIAHFLPQAEQSGISLSVDVKATVQVLGDAGRLEQVLDNLLSNALTHTVSGGRVTVTINRDSEAAVFAVADTGEGISPEALPRIFERFYRGDKSRHGSGTGLGLAIVQEIVRAHKGTIGVESVVGLGSKFTVRLPLCR
jgi:signal transduction histidine kinase